MRCISELFVSKATNKLCIRTFLQNESVKIKVAPQYNIHVPRTLSLNFSHLTVWGENRVD